MSTYVSVVKRDEKTWVVYDSKTGNPFAFFEEYNRAVEYATDLNYKYSKLQETTDNSKEFLSENT